MLLGLLAAWSIPGVLVGVAAFAMFPARTPVELAAVDARRHQWRQRSSLALRIGITELAVVALLVAAVVTMAGVIAGLQAFWVRRPLRPIKAIGFQQMGLGLAVAAATATGVHRL